MPSAVALSILIHAALFLLAGMLVVFTVVKKEEKKFIPPKAVERPKMKLRKPKVKVKKTSKPKPTMRIVTKVNRASMPDIQLPEMSGMADGLAGGMGGFDMMPDFDDGSIFGGRQTIGNDFEGHLYSLRYDRNHRKILMDPEQFRLKVRDFIRSGWKPSKLAQYYRSPTTFYTTHFIVPAFPAPMALERFGSPELPANLFFLHYKGQLVCPASYPDGITFRFRGSGDAYLAVRVDEKDVLLATWRMHSPYFDWWKSSSPDNRRDCLIGQLSAVGDWITLEPGKPLAMEVLYGEFSGGFTGVALVVEVKGEEYNERGWQGTNPIFPAFKTEELSQDMINDIQFYLAEGELSLTNGPVFRDYELGKGMAGDKRESRPVALPSDGSVGQELLPEEIPLHGDEQIRMWTMGDGHTFEANFMAQIGVRATFKNAKGRVFKIPLEQLSEESKELIQLEMPPRLNCSFSKQSRQKEYPSTVIGRYDADIHLPKSIYYDFSVKIEQTSARNYDHELQAELFVIGTDIGHNNHTLLDIQKGNFTLTKENQRFFRLKGGKSVELSEFIIGFPDSGKERRGRKYTSYLVVVTDSRGEIIAHETPKKWLFENLENLRKLSVGNYFDKTCTRVGPSRPRPYYYLSQ